MAEKKKEKKEKPEQKGIDALIAEINNRYLDKETGDPAPLWENSLDYDTNVNTLEPLYYWLIDFIPKFFDVEKISDTFTASPGSSYFADLGARATKMQEEGMKIMATVNAVVKSIINLIYDLRNFDLRLKQYDKAKSDDKVLREEGILGLKEIWMNSVDAQRGMGSINNMAHQYGFTTLRPAFMAATSVENVNEMDLNEIVKRILRARVGEFFEWVSLSEIELKKRFEIEKSYLKNQIDTLNLYSTWVGPYLKAAEQLRMKDTSDVGLVSVFGSMILELTLLGKKRMKAEEEIWAKDLPQEFMKKLDDIRDVYKVLTVSFKFRTYPSQQAPHAGRMEIKFKSYVLNEDEMTMLEEKRREMAKESMLNVAMNLSESSLKQLQEDIDYFTKEKKEEDEEENLFEDLYHDLKKMFFGQTIAEKKEELKKKKQEEKEEKDEKKKELLENGIPEDTHEESVVRELAEVQAAKSCFDIFDTFKKSQGMASFPNPFDQPDVHKRIRQRIAEAKATINVDEEDRKVKEEALNLHRKGSIF